MIGNERPDLFSRRVAASARSKHPGANIPAAAWFGTPFPGHLFADEYFAAACRADQQRYAPPGEHARRQSVEVRGRPHPRQGRQTFTNNPLVIRHDRAIVHMFQGQGYAGIGGFLGKVRQGLTEG